MDKYYNLKAPLHTNEQIIIVISNLISQVALEQQVQYIPGVKGRK